jgi:hypothetical protein
MRRVYPTNQKNAGGDEVEMMVKDIEDDLREFTTSSDMALKDMYEKATFEAPEDKKESDYDSDE